MIPLGLIGPGEQAEILEVRTTHGSCREDGGECCGHGHSHGHGCGDGKCVCRRVDDMGLRKGQTVKMLNNEGRGPVLLKLGESRVAIGRGMAMKIMVRIVSSGSTRKGGGCHETVDA